MSTKSPALESSSQLLPLGDRKEEILEEYILPSHRKSTEKTRIHHPKSDDIELYRPSAPILAKDALSAHLPDVAVRFKASRTFPTPSISQMEMRTPASFTFIPPAVNRPVSTHTCHLQHLPWRKLQPARDTKFAVRRSRLYSANSN